MLIYQHIFCSSRDSKGSLWSIQVYFTCISFYSRRAYVITLRPKKGDEVAKVLEFILEQNYYRKIQTDQNCEFVNSHIKKILLEYKAMLYYSQS